MSELAQLFALRRPFREAYLPYEEIVAQVEAWIEAFPHLMRRRTLGTTPEGRELLLLEVGRQPERTRPAVWIDGNMHAMELAGSSVALAVAEDVLALLLAEDGPTGCPHLDELPAGLRAMAREVLFYVVPRISPDGAEAVLDTATYIRSTPRDERTPDWRPRWVSRDLDGDGLALAMRQEDPTGELVANPQVPQLLMPRRLDSEGPFYKLYPEGVIEDWDGVTVPDPHFLSDNEVDLNRNFPHRWEPEPTQAGAGPHPTSAMEARAVVDFVHRRPHIFGWLNLHCFGGVFIRPYGHLPDTKMAEEDLQVFKELERHGEACTGYPTVSGFHEFLYEPDTPLHGDLIDYVFHQRGAVALALELWDLFRRIGMEKRPRFVDHYGQLSDDDRVRLAEWDREHNQGRVLRPWTPIDHPQLGPVEVGGIDPRIGIWNPPPEILGEVCTGVSAFFLHLAAMSPRIVFEGLEVTPAGETAHRVQVTVANHGYLPTYVTAETKDMPFNEPLHLHVDTDGDVLSLPSGSEGFPVGHLQGWGRGRDPSSASLFYLRSKGSVSRRTITFVVVGPATTVVKLRCGSSRVGYVEADVTLPGEG